MAYNFTQVTDDEDQQNQNGNGGGSAPSSSGPSIGSVMGGSSAAAPQQTPKPQSAQEQSGTGFVNLQSWLNAGQGRDQNIKQASDGGYSTDKASLDKAATDTTTQIDSNKPITSTESARTLLSEEVAGTKTNLSNIVNQKYTGPAGLTWQSGQGANDLGMLSGADTAGDVTARNAINAGQYGQGLRALDTAIYGADPNSIAAMGGAANNLTKLGGDATTAAKSVGDHATAVKKSIDNARQGAVDDLTGFRQSILDQADATAKARNANIQAAMAQQPTGGSTQGAWVGPTSVTRDDFLGSTGKTTLNALNKYLGINEPAYDANAPTQSLDGYRQVTPPPTAPVPGSDNSQVQGTALHQQHRDLTTDQMNEVTGKFQQQEAMAAAFAPFLLPWIEDQKNKAIAEAQNIWVDQNGKTSGDDPYADQNSGTAFIPKGTRR